MKRHLLFVFTVLLPLLASAEKLEKIEIGGICYNLDTESKQAEVTVPKPRVDTLYNEKEHELEIRTRLFGPHTSGDITIPPTITYDGEVYSVTSIEDGTFAFCDITSITIPESITSIGVMAFRGCDFTSITIPKNVTSIADGTFVNCRDLENITIPEGVTSFGENAFANCCSLESITIPESVKFIGDNAFARCTSLSSIVIPEGVRSIGELAFTDCESLTSITCLAVIPPAIGRHGKFEGVDKSIPVYVPAGSVDAYKKARGWKKFSNIIALPH